jgi:hypothetical protein
MRQSRGVARRPAVELSDGADDSERSQTLGEFLWS